MVFQKGQIPWNYNPVFINCLICKKIFKTHRLHKRKYCSIPCLYKSRKGRPGYTKGKKLTIEHKKKLALAKKGKPSPQDTKTYITCKSCGKIRKIRPSDNLIFCSKNCAYKGRMMPIPWNKDLKGIHLSPKSEFKRGQNAGENNWNWMGGRSTEAQKIRSSWEYTQWRKAVFRRDNWICQICFIRSTVGIKVILHADHIKPFSLYPELRFELSNGRTLCETCHKKTDTWGFKIKKITSSEEVPNQ